MVTFHYNYFSSKISRNCLTFIVLHLIIGIFISLLVFPIINYSEILLSVGQNSFLFVSDKDKMLIFLLIYLTVIFFVVEFLMRRALETYISNNTFNFDILKIRGIFTKYFWKKIFLRIIFLSLFGVILGFFLLYLFIRIRLNYLEGLYVQESFFSFFFDINYKFFQVISLVIILTIFLVIINILSLRLTNKVNNSQLNIGASVFQKIPDATVPLYDT